MRTLTSLYEHAWRRFGFWFAAHFRSDGPAPYLHGDSLVDEINKRWGVGA